TQGYASMQIQTAFSSAFGLQSVPPRLAQRSLFSRNRLLPDTVRFSAGRLEQLSPPSHTFQVALPGGQLLNLRQWWQRGEPQPSERAKGRVFFLVHGMSGRSAWMAPLVDELMKKPENRNALFYGIDMP